MWRREHREQHERYRRGNRPMPINRVLTLRRDNEFELALVQRGKRAKEAAIKRGEIHREAA